ncbi:TetR/AcrR family transcriptional regulator [Streptomyces gamaensis]|uniref:TetR/AcrR family transcriptional regulator n=1 Tax=Streptomyces gamaensis TaxID=1763542 RepID=A0ABW0Z3I0_9ACTN
MTMPFSRSSLTQQLPYTYKNSILKHVRQIGSGRGGRIPGKRPGAAARTREGGTLTKSTQERPRRGRPPRLSREHIVTAAYEIILKEGAENLTMRRLATALGSTAMAVYHHVRDKDELLALVLEHVARNLPHPELPEEPRARLEAVCALMHRAFVDNPWVVPIVARGELVGASALWMTEEIIGALVSCGLGHEEAFWAHQTLWYYTAGQVLATVPRHGEEPPGGAAHWPEGLASGERQEEFPHLSRLAGSSRELEQRYSYLQGVRHVLDGVLP